MTQEVVCLHGYGAGGRMRFANFSYITPVLQDAGYRVSIPSFPAYGTGRMRDNINAAREALLEAAHWSPTGKTHAIGHSLGALVLHAYAKFYPEEAARILDKVIMLGGPHRGTKAVNRGRIIAPLAYLLSDSMRKMAYESGFVKKLELLPLPEGPEFHAIAARGDDKFFVSPWDVAIHITGAKKHIIGKLEQEFTIDGEPVNVIYDDAGHLTMVMKESVHNTILEIFNTNP